MESLYFKFNEKDLEIRDMEEADFDKAIELFAEGEKYVYISFRGVMHLLKKTKFLVPTVILCGLVYAGSQSVFWTLGAFSLYCFMLYLLLTRMTNNYIKKETKQDKKGLKEHLENMRCCYKLAVYKGDIVGSVCISEMKSKPLVAECRRLYVKKKFRGLGVGKKLLEIALAFSKKYRFKHVCLTTSALHNEARQLYKKYGFKEEGLVANELVTHNRMFLKF
ncbi:probable N-acetyltransferase camello [Anneissia japonica]|uniref:probable N-acetyltransferase camello n=1 Tax=Anneissia japonica TaxID=1529436 RepID=UPI0014258A11|nr:probable N-acetyltransferase camello [Anneissia japonica]